MRYGWFIALILVCSGCATAQPPRTLDDAKKLLEVALGGKWQIETRQTTDSFMTRVLQYQYSPTNHVIGVVNVFQFPQDAEGRKRIDRHMSTCQAPLYVLGHNVALTVITTMPRTNAAAMKIMTVLNLSPPSTVSETEKWVNQKRPQDRGAEHPPAN